MDTDSIRRKGTQRARQTSPSPLPPREGRVALLGIAQRQIRVSFSQKLRKQHQVKALPENIQSLGDWIHVKRREQNMTPGHLAAKMGIASALVCSWESGESQPDSKQLQNLANYFGFGSQEYVSKPHPPKSPP
ncbi:MAG: helix-turn-helix transcriptional regulator [Verrucomicrobia bacterium]|nr:helix-turn-helix transcriptional regulator [Verrucomicrobiota bacterium]